ncbi:MAG TPA: polysaccharide pyruvyl transferase family protein [Pyrinomonadaceae bacterium]|nr:polysaccharide pyruvyl transferase family protein [Pyrinomonadaceae bacterium]
MISHLGTFDVENYGDLLYPIVLKHLLKKDPSLKVRHYSPLPVMGPQEAGFETSAIATLFTSTAPATTLIIGGGDILRTDWDTFASHYSTNSYHSLRRSIGPLDACSYLLRTKIPRGAPAAFFVRRFRKHRLNYSEVGPFLIDSDMLPQGSVISYMSCGVPHEFSSSESESVRRVFDQASFIYLRDEQSAAKLRRAGFEREIHVAPDLAITLSDQFDREMLNRRGREILSRIGIERDSPFLCFQCKPYPSFDEEAIVNELKRYQERTNCPVVLLPIGYCHGDDKFLQSLAGRSGGSLKYANVNSIADIMSVIVASDLFIGTSLHGNITAASYGIPHLFGPLPVDKIAGFVDVMKLPPELQLRSWTELNDKIDFAVELGREYFSARAAQAKTRVYEVMNQLLLAQR